MAAKPRETEDASELLSRQIEELGGWRGNLLAHVRGIIREADPRVVEERKWRKPSNPAGVPVWSHDGIICTGEVYKDNVRMTFAKGASLKDPRGLFNASLQGNALRAIVIHEGDRLNEDALKDLIRAAVALNESKVAAKGKKVLRS